MADYFIQKLEQHDRLLRGDDPTKEIKLPQEVKDKKAADDNWRAYVRSRDSGHLDYIKMARKCDAYYFGDQWEATAINDLNRQRRPHLTFNMGLTTINSVLGEHIKTRQELTFLPRGKGATTGTARALASVVKQIQYNNKSQWNEQMVLADGIIEDRGYFDIRMDFSDNIYGEIREKVRDPRDVLLDSEAKEYDPSTWNEVITTRWLTPQEISAQWGSEKAEQLAGKQLGGRYSHDSIVFETPTTTFGDQNLTFAESDLDLEKVKRIRLIERQHRVLTRMKYFVDLVEGDMRQIPENWDNDKVAMFAALHDLEVVMKPERKIRWTISADDLLLFDGWSLYSRFTIVPFFPYFRRGKPSGMMRHLLSAQDMLNKVTSQELHVVNTTANSGWVFEQGSLVNMDADDLERVGAKTGLVLEYKRESTPPEKIKSNEIPAGLSNVATKAQHFFRAVSGISEASLGFSSREVSGVAIDEQKSSGSQSLEIVFDNLAKTRQYRAELYLEMLQNFYTEPRLIQVTELDVDGREQTNEIQVNEETPEGSILNDLTLGEYGIVVASVPHAETQQDSIFGQAAQMRELGVAIPDFVMIENSRIPNRLEISEMVKKIQGMADPTPEEIERILMQQQIDVETQLANLANIKAQSMEREAKAAKAMAEAGVTERGPLLEMQKAGAEMRVSLEQMAAKLEQTRMELQTRVAISRENNETKRFEATTESMTKRTNAGIVRATSLINQATKAESDRLKIIEARRARSPTNDN